MAKILHSARILAIHQNYTLFIVCQCFFDYLPT